MLKFWKLTARCGIQGSGRPVLHPRGSSSEAQRRALLPALHLNLHVSTDHWQPEAPGEQRRGQEGGHMVSEVSAAAERSRGGPRHGFFFF